MTGAERIALITSYLEKTAGTWWNLVYDEAINQGQDEALVLYDWLVFEDTFLNQFKDVRTQEQRRDEFDSLRQTTTVQNFRQDIDSRRLYLDPRPTDADCLLLFKRGLKKPIRDRVDLVPDTILPSEWDSYVAFADKCEREVMANKYRTGRVFNRYHSKQDQSRGKCATCFLRSVNCSLQQGRRKYDEAPQKGSARAKKGFTPPRASSEEEQAGARVVPVGESQALFTPVDRNDLLRGGTVAFDNVDIDKRVEFKMPPCKSDEDRRVVIAQMLQLMGVLNADPNARPSSKVSYRTRPLSQEPDETPSKKSASHKTGPLRKKQVTLLDSASPQEFSSSQETVQTAIHRSPLPPQGPNVGLGVSQPASMAQQGQYIQQGQPMQPSGGFYGAPMYGGWPGYPGYGPPIQQPQFAPSPSLQQPQYMPSTGQFGFALPAPPPSFNQPSAETQPGPIHDPPKTSRNTPIRTQIPAPRVDSPMALRSNKRGVKHDREPSSSVSLPSRQASVDLGRRQTSVLSFRSRSGEQPEGSGKPVGPPVYDIDEVLGEDDEEIHETP
jgi:hypothetical protein